MNSEDIVFRKRPHFENKDLQEFEKRMKDIEWDNKEGEGVLSEDTVRKIAETLVEKRLENDKKDTN